MLTLNLLRGRSGRAFEAIRNDELAAEVLGVPTRRYKIFAFAYCRRAGGPRGRDLRAFLGIVVPERRRRGALDQASADGGARRQRRRAAARCSARRWSAFSISAAIDSKTVREVAYGLLVIVVVIAAPAGAFGLIRSRFASADARAAAGRCDPAVDAAQSPPRRPGDCPLAVERVSPSVSADSSR